MEQMLKMISGRKSYLSAMLVFNLALWGWLNGELDVEKFGILASVAGMGAGLRASVGKLNGKAAAVLLVAGLASLYGCASLGTVDPATGTTPAQDIQTGTVEPLAALLPPPFSTIVPIASAGLMTLLIALGKKDDAPT